MGATPCAAMLPQTDTGHQDMSQKRVFVAHIPIYSAIHSKKCKKPSINCCTSTSSDHHPDNYHILLYIIIAFYHIWHSIWHILWHLTWHSDLKRGILLGIFSGILEFSSSPILFECSTFMPVRVPSDSYNLPKTPLFHRKIMSQVTSRHETSRGYSAQTRCLDLLGTLQHHEKLVPLCYHSLNIHTTCVTNSIF